MEPACNSVRILLIGADEAFAKVLNRVLGRDYALSHVSNVQDAIPRLDGDDVDVAMLDWQQPEEADPAQQPPVSLLKALAERPLAPPVIVFSWDTRREVVAEVAKQGGFDFFSQPLDILQLKFALDRAYQRKVLMRDLASAQRLISSARTDGLLGNSKGMERIREVVRKVAAVFTSVLVTGESGTGKEVVARAIHRLSPRVNKPFVAFSPCALPDTLIEDELFGHEKGAFTGASQSRRGRFEEAQGGTIFLDEIGDLALPLQSKLLRVLQERTLERLGSNVPVPVDVRVVCATNKNLERMVQEGTFRQDLYFRISVLKINMPPLRERADDIPLLAEYFCRQFATAHNKNVRGLSPGFLSALTTYRWPGNVRELQNVIERSLVLADGQQLGVADLPPELKGVAVAAELTKGSFQDAVRSFKRELIRAALRTHSGNKLRAARELSISRCYLHRLMNQLNIPDDESGDEELGEQLPAVPEYLSEHVE